MTRAVADLDAARRHDDGAPVSPSQLRPEQADDRLVWAPADAGGLAGAWWPRSRDAATELQTLLPAAGDQLGGRVTRVSLNIDAWNADQPRRLVVGDQLVRLGWFHTLDPATVTVGRGTHHRMTLVVVPPDLDETAARGLLRHLDGLLRWPDDASAALSAGSQTDGAGKST